MELKLSKFKEAFEGENKLKFKKPIAILAGLVVLLLVFTAGVFVGMEKTRFSYRWGENYYQNFIGERGMRVPEPGRGDRPGMMPFGPPPLDDYFNAHGVAGEIISVSMSVASSTSTLIIKDKDDTEKNILLDSRTIIKNGRQDLKPSDLKIGEKIVVIGAPNEQGQILSKLIRVQPENLFNEYLK